jgi:four helix bundle protein
MPGKTHKDLIVWRKAVALATRVYRLTGSFAGYERQTLAHQMRRCAVSVASNIAEGAARASRMEYIRFLDIARGSLSELETQVYICTELGLLRGDFQVQEDVAEVGRMLTAMIRRLREHRDRARGFQAPPRPLTSQ